MTIILCRTGNFEFHYGSAIGTHEIAIRNKEKQKIAFSVVVI